MTEEHRHFTRIPFDSQVRIVGDGIKWSSTLMDVSLNGALVEYPPNWTAHIGDRFQLEILLSEDQTVCMDVSVAHMENGRIGFHCEQIDVDSISHLRRLVELNSGDPELLHRELSALGQDSNH